MLHGVNPSKITSMALIQFWFFLMKAWSLYSGIKIETEGIWMAILFPLRKIGFISLSYCRFLYVNYSWHGIEKSPASWKWGCRSWNCASSTTKSYHREHKSGWKWCAREILITRVLICVTMENSIQIIGVVRSLWYRWKPYKNYATKNKIPEPFCSQYHSETVIITPHLWVKQVFNITSWRSCKQMKIKMRTYRK